jgi:hypothetical protein
MSRRKRKQKQLRVVYWEEVPVSEYSLDSPVGSPDDDLTLMDTIGSDEAYDLLIDESLTRQQIIFSLPEIEQVEVLILKQLGYRYWEIKRILRLRSLSHYYQIFGRLRDNYLREMKKIKDKDI